MEMSVFFSFCLFVMGRRGGERQWKEDEVVCVFSVLADMKSKLDYKRRNRQHYSEDQYRLYRSLVWEKLSCTEHTFVQHLTPFLCNLTLHMFSHQCTELQTPFLLPQARRSFHFSMLFCHICRFLLLFSFSFFFSGVISTCTTLPETYGFLCSTYRRVLSHIQHSQQRTFMSAYFCSHLLPLFPAVLAQCMQRDAKCAWPFPRHKSSFHTWPPPLAFLPFSQPLLTGQERKAPRTRLCFPLRC